MISWRIRAEIADRQEMADNMVHLWLIMISINMSSVMWLIMIDNLGIHFSMQDNQLV